MEVVSYIKQHFVAYDYNQSYDILKQHFGYQQNIKEKKLFLCIGANGAGKSTTLANMYSLNMLKIPYYNADMLDREQGLKESTTESAKRATDVADKLVDKGASFCYETVFSHPSKLDLVKKAKQSGYKIIVLYIDTHNPDINIKRVQKRVLEGGHNVPEEKIRLRFVKCQNQMIELIRHCDVMYFFDNSKDKTYVNKNEIKCEKGE